MIKLAVFDWNGTLLADTKAELVGANAVLRRLNQPLIDLNGLQAAFDSPIVYFYKNIGVDFEDLERRGQAAMLAEIFHANYGAAAAHARTRPGARKVLTALRDRSVTSIILSNHTLEGIYLQLERLRLTSYFNAVLAHDVVDKNHFQSKEQYLHNYLRVNPTATSSAIMIGDTSDDIKIGKNLGFKTIAISGGYNSPARLRAAQPDKLIHSLNDLLPALKEL
jgi:phosphoglycolate phosphatase